MKNRWVPALVATILLTGGLELFFRFAVHPAIKGVALALVGGGVVILGASGWQWRQLQWKLFAGTIFVVYLIEATRRFPGLVKDSMPDEVAVLVLKALATLIILTASIAAGIRLIRASRRGLLGNRSQGSHIAR